jgi:ketosteroid isomerase-like protein
MSQENVELVRRIWEAVDRRDSETVLSLYDSEVELDVSGVPLVAMEAKEFIDAGGDELVVQLERHGRSRRRGLDFEGDWYWVYTMRQGRVVRIREFDTRQQALEAVGLRE